MSKSAKKGSSCLGLFVKSWILSALFLGGTVAGTVGLGIRYLDWSAQTWGDFSTWSSPPVLASIGVSVCATVIAFCVAAFIGAASAFLSRGSGKSGGSTSSKPKVRPQSSRKTTV